MALQLKADNQLLLPHLYYAGGVYTYFVMNQTIEQSLDKIEKWLEKQRFALLKSKLSTIEDEVDFERKVVFLSLKSKPMNQLYSLLHECGHVIIRKRKDYKERYKESIAFLEGDLVKETNRCSVEQIEEEILAWREGFTLASKLDIVIDSDTYYKYSSRWVMSYIVKASIGKEYLYLSDNKIDSSDKTEKQNKKTTISLVEEESQDDVVREEPLDT